MKSKLTQKTIFLIVLEILMLLLSFASIFSQPRFAVLYIIYIVLFLYHLRAMADTIVVDHEGIMVRNWFIQEKRRIKFDQLDKVVIYKDPIETRGRLTTYLLKDNVIFCKIRGQNYQNLYELVEEIEKRKNLL